MSRGDPAAPPRAAGRTPREDVVEIRPARREDAARLAALMDGLGYPTGVEQMARRLEVIAANPDYHTLVAEVEGQVVGMIGLCRDIFYEREGVYVRILALVVDAERRGAGIGGALVREAERWAAQQGAGALLLNSGRHRADAHRFYERRGYEATGLRFSKLLE